MPQGAAEPRGEATDPSSSRAGTAVSTAPNMSKHLGASALGGSKLITLGSTKRRLQQHLRDLAVVELCRQVQGGRRCHIVIQKILHHGDIVVPDRGVEDGAPVLLRAVVDVASKNG